MQTIEQVRDAAKVDVDAKREPSRSDMEQVELGREGVNPPQHDGRQNQPALHSLPANALDDDPQQQGEEQEPQDQRDRHEMEGSRMRDNPEEDLFSQNG
jgi:hypothetical protein